MKASEEIRSILDRCKSGELEHKQAAFYFCGTARCVAGWKVHFDYCRRRKVKKPSIEALWTFAKQRPGNYAKRAWGLNQDQSERLFGADATYDEQYAVVAELEAQGK